jgi:hypothetical protein
MGDQPITHGKVNGPMFSFDVNVNEMPPLKHRLFCRLFLMHVNLTSIKKEPGISIPGSYTFRHCYQFSFSPFEWTPLVFGRVGHGARCCVSIDIKDYEFGSRRRVSSP